jgi:hypothetical protein
MKMGEGVIRRYERTFRFRKQASTRDQHAWRNDQQVVLRDQQLVHRDQQIVYREQTVVFRDQRLSSAILSLCTDTPHALPAEQANNC